MATMLERPLSALGSSSRASSTHSNTREVIDVDSFEPFDDDDIQFVEVRPPPRQLPRPAWARRSNPYHQFMPEPYDDNDDGSGPSSTRLVQRRRRFSPPPTRPGPHSSASDIPPVPRIPSEYAGQTSMIPSPLRQAHNRTGPPPPPPVQAMDRTFEFSSRRPSPPVAGPSHAPRAAARSHHVPSMGLGGAIISNHARAIPPRNGAAGPSSGSTFSALMGVPHTIRRIYPNISSRLGVLFGDGTRQELLDAADYPEDDSDEDLMLELEGYPPLRSRDRFRQPLPEKVHYKSYYTHPTPVEPGFTHSFESSDSTTDISSSTSINLFPPTSKSEPIVIKDDDDDADSTNATQDSAGSSAGTKDEPESKMSMLLVCARCHDPLVLNSGLTGADASNKRIWALRCGHMLDGKCLAEIGQPAVVVDRKGKGKAKEEVPYGEDPIAFCARSGGDAEAEAAEEEGLGEDQDEDGEPAEGSGIRSRLRSGRGGGAADEQQHQEAAASAAALKARKRKRAPAKSRSSKKAKIEDEFEWECPVPNCGKVHASVKVNGGWGPEKERQLKKSALSALQDVGSRGVIQVFA